MVDQRTKRWVARDHMDAVAKRHRENEMKAVATEAVEELNCHQRQEILGRKTQQYEKTCELAERLFVVLVGGLVGGPTWSHRDTPNDTARAAWMLAEAMIDFANEQEPVEEAEATQ
jgi:hypothetical protein